MDRILIEGLKVQAHVGVPEEERNRLQQVVIDIELGLSLQLGGQEDRVECTVDYAAVTQEVTRLLGSHSFRLVEALAHEVAQCLLDRFEPAHVRVRVRKFSVPDTQSVGAEITRFNEPGRSRTKSEFPRTAPR